MDDDTPPVIETKKEVPPAVTEEIKEEVKVVSESVVAPTDLFGSELPPAKEKPKQPEKKEEKIPVNKILKPAIDDIKKAIGINDKFQFTNELFKGNNDVYSMAIEKLNSSGTKESAMEYAMQLKEEYNWDLENETVKRLMELVERRYS